MSNLLLLLRLTLCYNQTRLLDIARRPLAAAYSCLMAPTVVPARDLILKPHLPRVSHDRISPFFVWWYRQTKERVCQNRKFAILALRAKLAETVPRSESSISNIRSFETTNAPWNGSGRPSTYHSSN